MDEEGCLSASAAACDCTLYDLVTLFRSAETGNAQRRLELAQELWNGGAFTRDRDAAEIWYELAALDGNCAAQLKLGDMWRIGLNGRYSARIAAFWYRQAAESYSPEGLYRLGCCYRDGEGVSRNQKRWIALMHRAADAGSLKSMLVLGDQYLAGGSVSRNWRRAVQWYCSAAEAGDVASTFLIGQIYRHGGYGVERDLNRAIVYFRIAAEQGVWQAQVELARTLLSMDPESAEAVRWLRAGLVYANEEDIIRALEKVKTGSLEILRWQPPRAPLRIPTEEIADESPVELTAREEVVHLSGLGDHKAQLELAEFLWKEGATSSALQWLERSARGGLAEAQYRMALMYQTGFLREKYRDMQEYWCNLAAVQGHKAASEMLASLRESKDPPGHCNFRARFFLEKDGRRSYGSECSHSDFSDEEIVDDKPAGTLYRRIRRDAEPLVVIRFVAPGAEVPGTNRVVWLRVPSDINTVSAALSWALNRFRPFGENTL